MFVVMSDSHGDRAIVEDIKAKYINQAEAIFHCGDSELPANDKIWNGITVVTGNCDYDSDYKEVAVRELAGYRILLTHGHLCSVNFGLNRLAVFSQENNCQIALFGHTHVLTAVKEGSQVFINPGSVSHPRGYPFIPTYALVDLNNKQITITYLNREHEILTELTTAFDL